MPHPPAIDLATAVEQLLDLLATGRAVTLDIAPEVISADALARLLAALHDHAQRRELAIRIDPHPAGMLCISSRQP
jgi:hypothetical protein